MTWRGPDAEVAFKQRVRMDPFGAVEAAFDTGGAAAGAWTVEARVGDSRIDTRRFELVSP